MSFYGFRFHELNGRVYVVNADGAGVADFEHKEAAVRYVREVAERRAMVNAALREHDQYAKPSRSLPPGTRRDRRGRYVRDLTTAGTVNKDEH